METKKNLKYLKAKSKVEAIKSFYGHITVYILVNMAIILINANVFNKGEVNFLDWKIYSTGILWGIGLFFHGLYVLVFLKFNNNFIRRWEEKKIKEILDKQK
jgi:hypothetical protein